MEMRRRRLDMPMLQVVLSLWSLQQGSLSVDAAA